MNDMCTREPLSASAERREFQLAVERAVFRIECQQLAWEIADDDSDCPF